MEQSLPIEYLRAILLLGIATAIWAVIKIKHRHASRSLEWLEGIVEGYMINAVLWSVIIGFAIVAAKYGASWILHLTLLILFTKLFGVATFIEVSSTVMSIIWGIEKQSNGRLNYRIYVVAAIIITVMLLIMFYSSSGLPQNPATFP